MTASQIRSIALALALGASPAAGQEKDWPAVFQDVTEVNVVNVEVFVSDAKGEPVTGLGKDDFLLFDDGEPVEISNFFAVEGGRPLAVVDSDGAETPPEERLLQLVIFVDNANLSARSRGRVFSRLRDFVLAQRRDDLRIMLASYDGPGSGRALTVRQDFTAVPHDVFVALEELEGLAVGVSRFETERRTLMRAIDELEIPASAFIGTREQTAREATAEATFKAEALVPRLHAYSQQRYDEARRTLSVLRTTIDMIAALPGRKALLYVSDGIPVKAGAALFEAFVDQVERLPRLPSDLDAGRFDATRELLAMTERASAARVAFYTLDAAPPAAARRGAAEAAKSRPAAAAERNRQEGLQMVAERTGGRAALGTKALDAVFESVYADFDNHYSLGFVAERRQAGPRSLEVRVRGEGLQRSLGGSEGGRLKVRHRRAFRDKSTEELMAEQVLAALHLDRSGDNPLDIAVTSAEAAPQDDGTFVVPLLVQIPVGKVMLAPGRNEHQTRLSMYVAARDEAGRISEVTRHLCPFRVANEEVLVALGRKMVCGVRLRLRGGAQKVAVAVRDELADAVATAHLGLDLSADAPGDSR